MPDGFDLDFAFKSISLFEISFNRSGRNNKISQRSDVLFQEQMPSKLKLRIISLYIKHLSKYPKFRMEISDGISQDIADMKLIHDPLMCNYSHSMIIFFLNGQVRVLKNNYDDTLNAKRNKNLRKACKDELHKMVTSRTVAF